MITAVFACAADAVAAVTVSGHAGYAPAGEDIVCASVSSAVQLTANALTEILGTKAQVKVSENSVKIVPAQGDSRSQDFLRGLAAPSGTACGGLSRYSESNDFGGVENAEAEYAVLCS